MTNFEKRMSIMTPTRFAWLLYHTQGCRSCPIEDCKKNKANELEVICIEKIKQWLEREENEK